MRVWDGTGPSKSDTLPINSLLASDATSKGDPPPACIQKIEKLVNDRNEAGDDDDDDDDEDDDYQLSAPPALCGRVINVAVWENAHWLYLTSGWLGTNFADISEERRISSAVSVGDWIRLRNVTDGDLGRAKGGIRALHIRERTGLTLLPSTTFEISSILKNHAKVSVCRTRTPPREGKRKTTVVNTKQQGLHTGSHKNNQPKT